jgi:hypothetical protein
MRKSLTLALFFGLMPCIAQVQGGHESVQDAIRWERQKDAAAARQSRMESGRTANSTADRSTASGKRSKTRKAKAGSAARTQQQ